MNADIYIPGLPPYKTLRTLQTKEVSFSPRNSRVPLTIGRDRLQLKMSASADMVSFFAELRKRRT
jgi:hypothetical protein